MTLGEIGPPENLFWARKREDLYLLFKENLRKVASRLKVEIAEDQESRLLYYMTREVRHSILEPFILDENIKDIKVISPGLNALVIHKDYDFLGWLKTNAVFTDPRQIGELMARFVGKRPRKPIG
jgi:Flp pilus assembly CpaF family ATPase